jgi:transcriptional regulator with XRE-family HTH domain
MTLLEVADKLGVKEATVQRYESGAIKNLKYDTITALSDVLRCDPAYLMGWTDEVENLYEKLDPIDKAEIRGEMRNMLKAEKYKTRDAPTIAKDAADTIATAAEVFSGGTRVK